ncbi:MAG: hypothetical protein PHX51_01995 [Clostridia bacterium]|nr:hypothetical protein [Clostridia bacterium]
MELIKPKVDTLKKAGIKGEIERYKRYHSFVLQCSDSYVLTQTALSFAAALLCDNGGCGECSRCDRIMRSIYPDVRFYPKAGVAQIRVDDARDIVAESYKASIEGRGKVFILNSANSANDAGWQNMLLKTLEEPNSDTYLILCVNTSASLLQTVLSRCILITIPEPDWHDVAAYLRSCGCERTKADLVGLASGGSYGNALEIMGKKEQLKLLDETVKMLRDMKSSADSYKYNNIIQKNASFAVKMLQYMSAVFGELIKLHCTDGSVVENSQSGACCTILSELAVKYTLSACVFIMDEINYAKDRLDMRSRYQYVLDELILKILEVAHKCRQ